MELYKKYRPSTLDELVGNELTIKQVRKELENGSQVFLLHGSAGCGKTTIARIMAKEVGADDTEVSEINSAENRGIDTAREVMEDMKYSPICGRAKVWIFDECHQWLSPVQNAFLKALEDTPKHCYFFLCTTNPEKLIAPLKSRCSKINVKPLQDNDMRFLLKRTSRGEKIKISNSVIDKIVELAGGGARSALKLLTQVIYLDNEDEMLKSLSENNEVESNESIELSRLLLKGCTWKQVCLLLKNMDLSEPERIRQGVMGYMSAVLLNGAVNDKAVASLQAFSQADTYRNGKQAIVVACLDYFDMLG